MIGQVAQIDEHSRHAGDHFAIFDHRVEIARIGERPGQMMADFGDAGLDSERLETEVQKLTDEMIAAADELSAAKEQEILTQ